MEGTVKHTSLRILMTTDTVGGVWSYTVELCHALRLQQVHICLVTTGAPVQPAQQLELEQLENVTVYETGFPLEWMEDPWPSIDASAGWLLRLEEELQPDLIHINGYAYGALPWKAPVMVVAHSDVYSWWLCVKGGQPPAEWTQYFERVRAGLQQAGLIIAPSQTMMHYVRTLYAATTPAKVIYNGRSAGNFYPAQKQPLIFGMGRIWDEAKNFRLLMDAAPQIRYPVELAGDNSFARNSSAGEAANIRYLGKLPMQQIAAKLSVASIYVLPALYEPFGLSVLEAALSGCVLVLGNIDSLKELWGDSAVYVDTGNAAALADTINGLMENEEARAVLVQKAMQQAAKYTTAAMAGNYYQVYNQLQKKRSLLPQEII